MLPDFKNTHCVSLTACADIKSADRDLRNWLKKEGRTISVFKTALGRTFFCVLFGGHSGNHIHIDLGTPSVFDQASIPKAKRTVSQIQEKLEHLMGKEVEVELRGLFEVKLDELPTSGMIRTLFFETKMANVGIKMIGARFAILGAPIKRITWQMKSKKEIGVVFESHMIKAQISETYITNALTILESGFNVFILGRA
jgi:hypothetical protein